MSRVFPYTQPTQKPIARAGKTFTPLSLVIRSLTIGAPPAIIAPYGDFDPSISPTPTQKWYKNDPSHLIITGPQALYCLLYEMRKLWDDVAKMTILTVQTSPQIKARLATIAPTSPFFVVVAGQQLPEHLLDLCQRIVEEGHWAKVHLLAACLNGETVPKSLRANAQLIES